MTQSERKPRYTFEYGVMVLPDRRPVQPTGRLFILGKYLTVEQTSNYFKAIKETTDENLPKDWEDTGLRK